MSRIFTPDLEPKPLISTRVRCKADDLFKTLWVSTDLQAQLHKLRNDTNLMETVWMATMDALPKERYTWDAATVNSAATGKNIVASNRWRKVRFESPPAAMATKPFQNEEIQQCVDYVPGQRYIVEAQCNTSAPYGDKFDLLFRISILAESKTTCFLHVVFDIKWSPSMNRMLKGMVTKAVEGGVRGTYKTYRQVLETFYTVEDVPEAQIIEVEQEGEEAAVGAAAHVEPDAGTPHVHHHPPHHHHREMPNENFLNFAIGQLVWGDQVSAVSDMVGAGLQSAATEGPMARVLALVVTLSMVHTAVSMLHSVQTFCTGRGGLLWLLCLPITHVIDVPDSVMEVLCSLALVAGINYAIIRAAQASLGHARNRGNGPHAPGAQPQRTPSTESQGAQGTAHHARAASADSALGAAAPVAAEPTPKLKPGTTKIMGKGQPIPVPPPTASSTSPTKKGKPAAPHASSNGPAAPEPGAAPAPAKPAPRTSSPPPGAKKGHGSAAAGQSKAGGTMELTSLGSGGPKVASPLRLTSPPGSAVELSSMAYPPTSPPGMDPNMGPEPMKAWLRTVSSGIDSVTEGLRTTFGVPGAVPPGSVPANMHTSASSHALHKPGPLGTTPEGDGEEDGSSSGSGGAGAGAHATSEGGAGAAPASTGSRVPGQAAKTQVVYGARFPLSAMVSEMEARNAKQAAAAAAGGGSLSTMSMPVHLGFGGSAGSMGEGMLTAREVDPDVVEEEIFENERFQPFRGWGHTWPGHFLPSDRVGHWSDRHGKPGGTASMIFEQVEPPLPPGFRWQEDEWQLDVKGFEVEAVDENGWTYALDFNYLRYPCPAGGGKCTMKHFVRRRRWFRTRVREALDMPVPQPQEMDKYPTPHHAPGNPMSPTMSPSQSVMEPPTSPQPEEPHASVKIPEAGDGAASAAGGQPFQVPAGGVSGVGAAHGLVSCSSEPLVATIPASVHAAPALAHPTDTAPVAGPGSSSGSTGAATAVPAAANGGPHANGHVALQMPVQPDGPLMITRITKGDPLGGASSAGHSRHASGVPEAAAVLSQVVAAAHAAVPAAVSAAAPAAVYTAANLPAPAAAAPAATTHLTADAVLTAAAVPAVATAPAAAAAAAAAVPTAAAERHAAHALEVKPQAGGSMHATGTGSAGLPPLSPSAPAAYTPPPSASQGPPAPYTHTNSLMSWSSWKQAGDTGSTGSTGSDRDPSSLGAAAGAGNVMVGDGSVGRHGAGFGGLGLEGIGGGRREVPGGGWQQGPSPLSGGVVIAAAEAEGDQQ